LARLVAGSVDVERDPTDLTQLCETTACIHGAAATRRECSPALGAVGMPTVRYTPPALTKSSRICGNLKTFA
jgi:hypothetical protein